MPTVTNVIIKNGRNYIAPKPYQNLFVLNAIAVQTSSFPIRVKNRAGHQIWLLVSVAPEAAFLQGVTSRYEFPVMEVTLDENDGCVVEFGHIDFNSKYVTLGNNLNLPALFMSKLPDGQESEPADKRFVSPVRVFEALRVQHKPIYGAMVYPDYFRTSVLDSISDEDWKRLTTIDSGHIYWSDFLDKATLGHFVVIDDISECFIDVESKYVPKEAMVKIRHARIKSRIEESKYA